MRSLTVSLFCALTACSVRTDFDDFQVRRDASSDAANQVGADADTNDADADDADANDGDMPDAEANDATMPDASGPDAGGCTAHDQCPDNQFCNAAHACEMKRDAPSECTAAVQCLTDYCDPDGICCEPGRDCCDSDSECSGQYRCDVSARRCYAACTSGNSGNESSACKLTGHCSDAGNCVVDLAAGAGNGCMRDSMCAGNMRCIDNFCCNAACSGCYQCNNPGSLGVCSPSPTGTDLHSACTASGCGNDGTCNGNGTCRPVAAGTQNHTACPPSGCTRDGTCNGSGGCRAVGSGLDPNNACSGSSGSCDTGACNGSGACAPRSDGSGCGSGACGGRVCSGGACTECNGGSCNWCEGNADMNGYFTCFSC